jgi:hypothetical protein
MKNNIYRTFLAILFIASLPVVSNAQCDDEDFMDDCAELLGEYMFVKSFNVEHSKQDQESEFSYVFSKGTSYVITICDQNTGTDKMVVELYDRNRKLVASNYLKTKKTFYPKIGYPCQATGVYYMKYKFKSGEPSCGVSIIGFKK